MADDGTQRMKIEKQFLEDAVILRLSGQLREVGADQLREELDDLLEQGYSKIVFDLSELSFISSVGLGQMMRAFRAATSSDGYVRIVNPQPLVEEVFRFTKLHTLIAIFPTVEDALAAE
jgi:anti-anti-sigma factor